MRLTTRIATPADAALLSELAGATFALACPPHTTAVAIADFIAENFTPERFAEHLADPARVLTVADTEADIDGGAVAVGYSMLVFGEPADPAVAETLTLRPTVELSKFYTRAEAHGTGVAALLMTATQESAAARHAQGCWLGVNEENGRAIRFYEKHGFTRVGRKRFLVGGRYEDDHVLERPLRNPVASC